MSEKIAESAERDGGQAFPRPVAFDHHGIAIASYAGMSLRDWLAGQALAGIAQSVTDNASRETGNSGSLLLQAIEGGGALAYAMADAALAARK